MAGLRRDVVSEQVYLHKVLQCGGFQGCSDTVAKKDAISSTKAQGKARAQHKADGDLSHRDTAVPGKSSYSIYNLRKYIIIKYHSIF